MEYNIEMLDTDKINKAIEWKNSNDKMLITPAVSLDELENMWHEFNSMPKKYRRESDWKCIELFGMTNQDIYEICKSKFLSDDIKSYYTFDNIDSYHNSMNESFIDSDTNIIDKYYDKDDYAIEYTVDSIEKAKAWSKENNRIIIIPTRTLNELEDLWEAFQAMIHDHRKDSDCKSIELFGITNIQHYQILKSSFLKNDITDHDVKLYDHLVTESVSDAVPDSKKMIMNYLKKEFKSIPKLNIIKIILEMYNSNNSAYDEALVSNVISDIFDDCSGDIIETNPEITNMEDLPAFTPEEMLDMGVYSPFPPKNLYCERSDNKSINDKISTKEWFDLYRQSNLNTYEEFASMSSEWVSALRELTFGLEKIKKTGNDKEIDKRKQSIFELGWNPEIPFDGRSRAIAKEIYKESYRNTNSFKTKFIDLREFDTSISSNNSTANVDFTYENPVSGLKPIFIVLSEGKIIISAIIKKATNSIYSHSGISFDPYLKSIYTFLGKEDHGISIETFDKFNDDRHIAVYAFFVEPDRYENIESNIKYYLDNKDKTGYSIINLFTYLLNVKFNMNWRMMCSQFVDRILKLSNIDLTKKDPSLVSPAYFSKVLKKNRTVYEVYKGLGKNYDGARIERLVNNLATKATPVKESAKKFYSSEHDYINDIIDNIHDIGYLRSIKESSHMIHNEKIRNILNEYVFLDAEPYLNEGNEQHVENESLVELSRLIEKIMRPL